MIERMNSKKINYVWLFLVAATLLSWWAIESGGGAFLAFTPHSIGITISLVAAVKVYFVIMHYMEIAVAPLFLKVLLILWLTMTTASILLIYMNSGWFLS